MRPLNDDQLSSLLRQAKANQPKPAPGFVPRVMQAYQRQSGRSTIWRRLVSGTIRIPIPIGAVAAIALILVGVVFGRRSSEAPTTRTPIVQESAATKVVSQDRPELSLYGLRPVAELRPRILRSMHESK